MKIDSHFGCCHHHTVSIMAICVGVLIDKKALPDDCVGLPSKFLSLCNFNEFKMK